MSLLATEIQLPQTLDGKRLYAAFHTTVRPAGCVILVHGLGEYSGRYNHVVSTLTEMNIAVACFDLRGHGRSEGLRGYVADYSRYLDDLSLIAELTRQRFPSLPIVVYGHSLGGGIVANWCLKRREAQAGVVGVVLSSPWFRLTKEPPTWELMLARITDRFWPWFTMPARFRVRDLCRDQDALRQYRSDPLIHHRITVRLAIQAYDAGRWAWNHAEQFPVPVLGIHGGMDKLTSAQATREFCERAPRAEFDFYEYLLHETHNEPQWREIVYRTTTWVKHRFQSDEILSA